ncbi:24214_t:CDS:2 [Entrophospora sp. SA101]|nr:8104_t:CDS:2 [Entrophospora sp. SA101]CAJ0762075.1 24214_t:CDS:2 [Entrophospora sp. SA101]
MTDRDVEVKKLVRYVINVIDIVHAFVVKHRNIRNIVTQSKVDQEYDQYAGQIIKLAIFGV